MNEKKPTIINRIKDVFDPRKDDEKNIFRLNFRKDFLTFRHSISEWNEGVSELDRDWGVLVEVQSGYDETPSDSEATLRLKHQYFRSVNDVKERIVAHFFHGEEPVNLEIAIQEKVDMFTGLFTKAILDFSAKYRENEKLPLLDKKSYQQARQLLEKIEKYFDLQNTINSISNIRQKLNVLAAAFLDIQLSLPSDK